MIDLYFARSPNAYKVRIALEEMGLAYRLVEIDVTAGDQYKPEFLAINPNNKIPAIVDHAPDDGAGPWTVIESGAILIYLAEKTGRFLPAAPRDRSAVLQWLMWQKAGMGPMLGQAHHFLAYAKERHPYTMARYSIEAARLYRVLDERLAGRDHICDAYSIADMACWPWAYYHAMHGIDLADYPNVHRWFDAIGQRRAVVTAMEAREVAPAPLDDVARKMLFGLA